jgi:hypothetical protein
VLGSGAVGGPVGVVDDGRVCQLALGASLCVSEVGQVAHVGRELLGSCGGGRESPEGAAGDAAGLGGAHDGGEGPGDGVFRGHGGGYGRRWWCRWRSGNIVIIAVVAVHFYAAVSVAANALVISNAALGRRRARLLPLARQSSPPPSFDFVLRPRSTLSCPVAPHSIP